jgi:hypothetical protein
MRPSRNRGKDRLNKVLGPDRSIESVITVSSLDDRGDVEPARRQGRTHLPPVSDEAVRPCTSTTLARETPLAVQLWVVTHRS